jgi:hypothetical protein
MQLSYLLEHKESQKANQLTLKFTSFLAVVVIGKLRSEKKSSSNSGF